MATTKYTTSDTYLQVTEAGSDLDFIIQNLSPVNAALLVFSDTTPVFGAAAHRIAPGSSMPRSGASGNVYIKSRDPGNPAELVVSAAAPPAV